MLVFGNWINHFDGSSAINIKEKQSKTDMYILKRLSLVKTTSWQHRFLDLTNLAPMWLRTYEYMKNTLQNYFFSFKKGFQIGFFLFCQKFSNLTLCWCTWKNQIFWAFFGLAKVSRPLVIPKKGLKVKKKSKNQIGSSGQPTTRKMNFWPALRRNLWFFWLFLIWFWFNFIVVLPTLF